MRAYGRRRCSTARQGQIDCDCSARHTRTSSSHAAGSSWSKASETTNIHCCNTQQHRLHVHVYMPLWVRFGLTSLLLLDDASQIDFMLRVTLYSVTTCIFNITFYLHILYNLIINICELTNKGRTCQYKLNQIDHFNNSDSNHNYFLANYVWSNHLLSQSQATQAHSSLIIKVKLTWFQRTQA